MTTTDDVAASHARLSPFGSLPFVIVMETFCPLATTYDDSGVFVAKSE